MDRNTLTLEFDPSLERMCINCGSCLRTCPMGIDIKDGLQIECINCGRCLDACREVMARLNREGLIHYTFGNSVDGGGQPLNRRSLLLGGIILLLCVLLTYGIASRKGATIKIQRQANGEVRRLPDGAVINFYSAYIENRSITSGSFSLTIAPLARFKTELIGPVKDIKLLPNDNRRIDLVVKVSPSPPSRQELVLNLLKDRKIVAVTPVPLLIK
jgi:polyferredoxin